MIYLYQRIIQNHFQWTRPSPGRLGPHGEGRYVQDNGFGHEDWNFNKNLLIDGYIYGYCYYSPSSSKRNDSFNIAYATYVNHNWYLIGFYRDCEFVSNPPVNLDVLKHKIQDLKQLGNSLGGSFRNANDNRLLSLLKDDAQCLKWRVLPQNAIRTNQPIQIPKSLFTTKNYRIVKPTELSHRTFNDLYALAEQEINSDYADESEFPEGRAQEYKHIMRERNQALVNKAKDLFKIKHGNLYCEICNFNFTRKYGAIGNDYIEAHHTIPISELRGNTMTKVEDIALVCSNCHKMLHRKRPWLNMNELKNLIKENV